MEALARSNKGELEYLTVTKVHLAKKEEDTLVRWVEESFRVLWPDSSYCDGYWAVQGIAEEIFEDLSSGDKWELKKLAVTSVHLAELILYGEK